MTDAFFRASVGACLFDRDGRVLVLRRKSPPDAWQMPQGGIGLGETPLEALRREVREETGLQAQDFEVAAEIPEWQVYEVPVENRNPKVGWGQAQRWFLCRFAASASRVRPDEVEFSEAQWIAPEELMRRVVPFRKAIYARVLAVLAGRRAASPAA